MRSLVRNCTHLVALAAMATAIHLSAQAPSWQPYSSDTDGFKVLFPSTPEVNKNSVPVGPQAYELRSYVSTAGTTALYIGVCDYGPKGATADPDDLLKNAENGAMDHMNAHLLTDKKIALGSHHGVAFEAESASLHFTARMYLSGGVLYQSMVATPLNEKFADTARFLDSFELIQRAPTETISLPAPTSDWKAYPYPTDGFSASFPFQPTTEKQTLTTEKGTLEFRTYTAEDSSVALIIAVCDYGTGAAGSDPQALLDGAKNGAVKNIKGILKTEKKITLGSYSGVEFEAVNESAHISARIYLVGTVLYQVIVAAPLKTDYAYGLRFLDSFQVLDRPSK